MQEKQAAIVLRVAIWALLLVSFALIMAGHNTPGVILAAISLVLNIALQRDSVRQPLIDRLTGRRKK
jgi:multisubunit Na+/H+ antiporter MnhB subunit